VGHLPLVLEVNLIKQYEILALITFNFISFLYNYYYPFLSFNLLILIPSAGGPLSAGAAGAPCYREIKIRHLTHLNFYAKKKIKYKTTF
jgi:hypothetical protein